MMYAFDRFLIGLHDIPKEVLDIRDTIRFPPNGLDEIIRLLKLAVTDMSSSTVGDTVQMSFYSSCILHDSRDLILPGQGDLLLHCRLQRWVLSVREQ
jgi:hypothetical protein